MKIRSGPWVTRDTHARIGYVNVDHIRESLLFDLQTDPHQLHPLNDPELEEKCIHAMIALMKENDAPEEQYLRLELTAFMHD